MRKNLVREPDAGDPHVRFDEREAETGQGEARGVFRFVVARRAPQFPTDDEIGGKQEEQREHTRKVDPAHTQRQT